MRKNNQKSLISVHFVCLQPTGSLSCSLAITTSLSIYIQVERLSKLLLHLAYVFQNIISFTGRSYLNSTLFTIALQESLSVQFVCFKICKLFGVLAVASVITRSSLFGLHLSREGFQSSFYTYVTRSKISSQNIKSHNY